MGQEVLEKQGKIQAQNRHRSRYQGQMNRPGIPFHLIFFSGQGLLPDLIFAYLIFTFSRFLENPLFAKQLSFKIFSFDLTNLKKMI